MFHLDEGKMLEMISKGKYISYQHWMKNEHLTKQAKDSLTRQLILQYLMESFLLRSKLINYRSKFNEKNRWNLLDSWLNETFTPSIHSLNSLPDLKCSILEVTLEFHSQPLLGVFTPCFNSQLIAFMAWKRKVTYMEQWAGITWYTRKHSTWWKLNLMSGEPFIISIILR